MANIVSVEPGQTAGTYTIGVNKILPSNVNTYADIITFNHLTISRLGDNQETVTLDKLQISFLPTFN